MIESSILTMLTNNLALGTDITWGKIATDTDYRSGLTTVNFFKLPSISARVTPSYLDSFQISVRNQYIDVAQAMANEITTLFHLYFGKVGSYRFTVDEIFQNGTLYEEEDIVHIPLTLRLKYTEL